MAVRSHPSLCHSSFLHNQNFGLTYFVSLYKNYFKTIFSVSLLSSPLILFPIAISFYLYTFKVVFTFCVCVSNYLAFVFGHLLSVFLSIWLFFLWLFLSRYVLFHNFVCLYLFVYLSPSLFFSLSFFVSVSLSFILSVFFISFFLSFSLFLFSLLYVLSIPSLSLFFRFCHFDGCVNGIER